MAIIAPAGMGKTALLDEAVRAIPSGVRLARLAARPFSTPMEVVRGAFTALGGDFNSEFGCGFSEVMVLAAGGLVAARASKLGADRVDDDIFGGMLAAVKSFIEDSFGGAGDRGLGRLEHEDLKVVIRPGKGFSLVGIISGPESPSMVEEMGAAVGAIESGEHGRMDAWNGSMAEMAGVQRIVQGLIEMRWPIPTEHRADAAQDVTRIAESLVERAFSSGNAVIVVEDVQWLSRDQRVIIAHLARGIVGSRVGLLVTSRPFVEQGTVLAPFHQLSLGPLTAAEIENLAKSKSGTTADLEKMSGGNPLFLAELLRIGSDFRRAEGSSLEALISDRIRTLDPRALEACEYAAAMGARFDTGRLAAVAGKEALDALNKVDFMTFEGPRGAFSHALYHSTVYESMSLFRRSHIHEAVAKATPTTDIYVLARHSLLAGRDASCIDLGMRAGNMAGDGHDHEVALWYYDMVLSHAKRFRIDEYALTGAVCKAAEELVAMGETAKAKELIDRHLPSTAGERRGSLLAIAASVAWTLGKYDDAAAMAEEAMPLALADRERMKAISVLLDVRIRRGEPQVAIEKAAALRKEFAIDSISQISLLMQMARGYEAIGDHANLRRNLDEAMGIAEKAGDKKMRSQVENQMGIHLFRIGKLDEALEHLETAKSIAQELKMLRLEVQTIVNTGNVHTLKGENDKALACYRRALDIARRAGYLTTEASAEGNIGNILMNQKKYEESQVHFFKSLKIFESMRDFTHTVYTLWSLAESSAYLGERVKGSEYAQRALDMSLKAKSALNEAWSWYIIGLVEGEAGDMQTARESLKVATSGYAKLGSAVDNAQIHAYWARLEAKRGDPEIAKREATAAVELYRKDGIEDKAAEVEKEVSIAIKGRT